MFDFLFPRPPRKDEVPEFWKGIYTINKLHIGILFVPPAVSILGLMFLELKPLTFFWAGIMYFLVGTGITCGYHRLWSHCAFTAHPALELWLAFWGAGAVEGSALWWCRNHRIHHRHVDTPKDPYNAHRGFVYSHFGWMFMNQNQDVLGRVDVSDLKANKIIMFQHRHYLPMAFLTAILIPGIIPWLLWDDFWGGICFAGYLKMFCVHHSTFFINSLAHWKVPGFSTQTYSDKHTSNDNVLVALATLGEGYHNFHHEFPQDYRNGVRVWHYDPTKWMIRFAGVVGLAVDLIRFPADQIEKGLLQMSFKHAHHRAHKLHSRLKKLDHGPDVQALPVMTWEDIAESVAEGNKLIVVAGLVYDLNLHVESGPGVTHRNKSTRWYDLHPGGQKILDSYNGKESTDAFTGTVYKHSNAAHNILSSLKIARLAVGGSGDECPSADDPSADEVDESPSPHSD